MSVASKFISAPALLGKYPPKGELPTTKELWKKAFFVAWPSTVESFLVALVGMVDTIMVSNLGAYAIAAIGLTNQPKFIALAVFMSLNVAVSALVARRKGENDQEGASGTAYPNFNYGYHLIDSNFCRPYYSHGRQSRGYPWPGCGVFSHYYGRLVL